MNTHTEEVAAGQRFEFGSNWSNFLSVLDEDRIEEARKSLAAKLDIEDLRGSSFLDIGCGSGLFSLAARQLGAKVSSFDFDPLSVNCAKALRRRYFPDESQWIVQQGSVLDTAFLQRLGQFDVVYSWGVLHHTGHMWDALDNAASLVRPGGRLFVSIYNDQGVWSNRWRAVKRIYNNLPRILRLPFIFLIVAPVEARAALSNLVRLKPLAYVRRWTGYKATRGMSRWHDWVDWIGGYPFEVASPEQIFDFYRERGFELRKLKTCGGGLGCNEFVFEKQA